MQLLGDILLALLGLAVGAWAGWRYATTREMSSARYWIANGVVFVFCVGACAGGIAASARWAIVLSMALLAGGLTGLKYGHWGGFMAPAQASADEDAAGAVPAAAARASVPKERVSEQEPTPS